MKIKSAFKYQINDSIKSMLLYYAFFTLIQILLFLFLIPATSNVSRVRTTVNGVEFSTCIFLFILGMCSFKENFLLLLQNSTSRRSVFTSRLLVSLSLAAAASIVDRAIFFIIKLVSLLNPELSGHTLFELIYSRRPDTFSSITLQLLSTFFCFFIYMAATSLGYMISILFYRLNKIGKILVGAGVPVMFLEILPLIDYFLFDSTLYSSLWKGIDRMFGISSGIYSYAFISLSVIAALANLFTWLMMRRSNVK